MTAAKLIFMGTPDYAVPSLDALLAVDFPIAAVYCQPPRPAGRGKKSRASPVQRRAEAAGLAVRTPVSLKDAQQQQEFAALGADLCIVVAYGLILPQAVLDTPRLGCINAHASLLPRWRGAAPIQRAIMAGDEETGVSIMQMDAGLDTGPVLRRESTPIDGECDAGELHDHLADISGRLLVEMADELCRGVAPAPVPQGEGASYAAKIDKAEARLDWRLGALELARRVRALSPHPGAWFSHGEARIKLAQAAAFSYDGAAPPGTVLRGDGLLLGQSGLLPGQSGLAVVCGGGTVLDLKRLQRAGKGVLDVAEFLRGHDLAAGEVLPCPATS
jgi:methionyl-tRNA formyltransferase